MQEHDLRGAGCDRNNNYQALLFFEGEQRVGGPDAGNYYYSRDHLGSVREVTNASGNLVAQYDYDAWGNEVVVAGNMNVDFGFTGHYFHQASGMNLSRHRAYNPTLGRWISRDPLKEAEMNQGANLYAYVGNDPVNSMDLLGLASLNLFQDPGVFGFLFSQDPAYWMKLAADRQPSIPGIFNVAGHGNPWYAIDSQDHALNPQDMADLITNSEGYDPHDVIVLDVCDLGSSPNEDMPPYAQRLANILQQEVWAPNGQVTYDANGFVFPSPGTTYIKFTPHN